jgi:hypothetical protein
MMLQLNPSIPMITTKGKGFAFMCIDYSQEHNLVWVVAITETGEIWCLQNHHVRFESNITFDRSGISIPPQQPATTA